jgi:hypothetical protein
MAQLLGPSEFKVSDIVRARTPVMAREPETAQLPKIISALEL